MKHKVPVLLVLFLAFTAAAAADTGSAAYNAGRIVGYVFVTVLVLLILKRLLKK
jgi:Skp family chaperone for outer membrane proteins